MDYYERSLALHEKLRGKIEINGSVGEVKNRDELSVVYTPGVAQPCVEIGKNAIDAYKYTIKGHTVAVVTDGSAVLGLGNIGGIAGLPVMEGKAVLFKQFGGVDAFPICLATQDTEEIIAAIKAIAPTFGGINLEDICSPKCFEVETRLRKELDIPVFHDDQHGTAIVVTAALMNALRIVKKRLEDVKVVVSGPGAAGTAIIKMLHYYGVKNIIASDREGLLCEGVEAFSTGYRAELCKITNPEKIQGTLSDALCGADVFIGVSAPRILKPEMIKTMAHDPVIFAMANPVPEISYDEAIAAGAAVVGTGRSDSPNQINNVLVFPGIFKGALDCGATDINEEMKLAAAKALVEIIDEKDLNREYIIPDIFDPRVVETISRRVAEAAEKTGVTRKDRVRL